MTAPSPASFRSPRFGPVPIPAEAAAADPELRLLRLLAEGVRDQAARSTAIAGLIRARGYPANVWGAWLAPTLGILRVYRGVVAQHLGRHRRDDLAWSAATQILADITSLETALVGEPAPRCGPT